MKSLAQALAEPGRLPARSDRWMELARVERRIEELRLEATRLRRELRKSETVH